MKTLDMRSERPDEFEVLGTQDLLAALVATPNQVLHQCMGCELGAPPDYHRQWCAYVVADWRSAVALAHAVLAAPPLDVSGLLDPYAVATTIHDELAALGRGDEPWQAATSLLTDPIEVERNGLGEDCLQNGRHRVAAILQQGLVAGVPVLRL